MAYPIKWTSAEVKKRLPSVKVKLFGKVHKGFVSGRRNKYATVWIQQGGHIYESQYSWSAVARALNANKPLKVS